MIPAAEALLLPSARLSESQQEKLAALEELIKTSVQTGVKNKIKVDELDINVLAAMDYQLKKAGGHPEWIGQRGTVDPNTVVHYWLNLDPEEAALSILTEAQHKKLERLDADLEAAVREHMEYKGCGSIKVTELDAAVLTAMTYRLKRLGWKPEWKGELGRTNKNSIINYFLNLDAEDSARDAAEEKIVLKISLGATS